MKFEQNIRIPSLRYEANKTHEDMLKRLDSIEGVISDRLDGRSGISIVGAIIVSVAYLIGVVPLCLFIGGPPTLNLVTLIVSVVFFGTLVLGNVNARKYYSAFLTFQKQIDELRNRVTTGKNGLVSKFDHYMSRGDKGWELALDTPDSVCVRVSDMEAHVKNMEFAESGLFANIRTALFYVTGILWTAIGSLACVDVTASTFYEITDYVSHEDLTSILYICICVACIADFFVLKWSWSNAGCKVTNGSALAVFLGPLVYFGLICAICFVVGVVVAIIYIVKTIITIAAAIFVIGLMVSAACAATCGG